jgi:hypothetical protein
MAKRRYHLDSQILTLSFFVAMPVVAFSSFIVVSMARSDLQAAAGRDLEQRALQTRYMLEHFIGDQIVQLRLIATDPLVIEGARASRSAIPPAQRREIERAWVIGTPPALLQPLLSSPLVPRLRLTTDLVPSLRVLQVLDARGQVVASTARASRPFQYNAPWYHHMAQASLPSAIIGDVQRSSVNGQPYFDVAYSIVDPKDGSWLGAVRGLVATADLYGVLASVRIGQTGHAVLIRESDGLVLAADEAERTPAATFPGFESIRAAMQARRGYWIVPVVRARDSADREVNIAPARLVGYSMVEQVPGVDWIVTVEQELDEATAPISGITGYLWLHFLGALASVFLLALYLSLRQETPVIEEELHIHETHVPPSMHGPDEGTPATETQGPLSVR